VNILASIMGERVTVESFCFSESAFYEERKSYSTSTAVLMGEPPGSDE
jgi:hypothetical protein